MGVYLSKPSTNVAIEAGKGERLSYVVGEMQGWRKGMEDDHIATVDFTVEGSDRKYSLFAVFDGHGGKEVAIFAKFYFLEELIRNTSFLEDRFQEALEETFLRIDNLLDDPRYEAELAFYRKVPNPSDISGGGHPTKLRFTSQQDQMQVTSRASVSSDDSLTSSEKKRVTTKQAVELLTQLIKSESMKKSQGEEVVSDAEAAIVPVDSTLLGRPPYVQSNGKPASITGQSGAPMCNLQDHRITAGCTAVVALKVDDVIYVANAGDSRAVLCRDGMAVPLSEDHKPSQARELARITNVGGFVNEMGRVNGNLNLSRSLGDLKYKQIVNAKPADQMITAFPDVTVTPMTHQDEFMLLACDGVWDILTSQSACDFVRERIQRDVSDAEIVSDIFETCISVDPKSTAGLGGDNMTCIIVRFNN